MDTWPVLCFLLLVNDHYGGHNVGQLCRVSICSTLWHFQFVAFPAWVHTAGSAGGTCSWFPALTRIWVDFSHEESTPYAGYLTCSVRSSSIGVRIISKIRGGGLLLLLLLYAVLVGLCVGHAEVGVYHLVVRFLSTAAVSRVTISLPYSCRSPRWCSGKPRYRYPVPGTR